MVISTDTSMSTAVKCCPVLNAAKAFNETTKRGAKPFQEPKVMEDANGRVVTSGIYTYGETVHMFVERNDYDGPFLPGYVAKPSTSRLLLALNILTIWWVM